MTSRLTRPLTHLLNEGNVPFARSPHSASFVDEVRAGLFPDTALGVVFHGTDARDPELAKQMNEASYFFDADEDWVQAVARRAQRNRAEIEDLGVPTFVTTPDMLRHVKGSQLLPISINVADWEAQSPPFRSAIPRVLHRPSGNSSTKGSKYILPALQALRGAGRIHLIEASLVPHAEMRSLIRSSDIVIDQLQSGTYGVTAVEAMAAGRLVVANLWAHDECTPADRPPILDATPSTFAERMNEILDSPTLMSALAGRGPAYVRRLHDGEAAAKILVGFVSGA